jgi:hypothetical protein
MPPASGSAFWGGPRAGHVHYRNRSRNDYRNQEPLGRSATAGDYRAKASSGRSGSFRYDETIAATERREQTRELVRGNRRA